MKIARTVLVSLLLAVTVVPPVSADDDIAPANQRLLELSTIPAEQLAALDDTWRNSGNIGIFVVSEELYPLIEAHQELLKSQGPEAVAKRLAENYLTDAASAEMASAALAVLADAGFGKARTALDEKKHFGPKEEDGERLLASVSGVIESLTATDHALARLAAAEFLLQVHSEGLICLHNQSGNGNRKPPVINHEVTALAAKFLDDPDPFVRALAEWSISITIANENDIARGSDVWPPQDGEAPTWFNQWMAVSPEAHLPYDYVRQAASLGMHRRAEDLVKLAKDASRRASERAEWVRSQGAGTPELESAAQQMAAALAKLESAAGNAMQDLPAFHNAWLEWRFATRQVVMQGPDLNFDSMVYIKRHSSKSHLQPSTHTRGQFADGGDIYVQEGLTPTSPNRALLEGQLGPGFAHDLDLWWDADRFVFAYKKDGVQKLFEMGLNGGEITQITDGAQDDVDPAYLPDGEIVFGSTRGQVGVQCASGLGKVPGDGGVGHTNIFRTKNGRTEIDRLSYCKDDDAYPHVLNDGRVVFMRWDYQERGVNEIFSLWVMHPDGTGADGFHRVHIPKQVTIQALRDTRAIEDTSLLVSAGGGHYNYAEGAVVLGDPREGINNPDSLKNVTPYASPVLYGWGGLEPVAEGGIPYVGGYYTKPWPLSAKSFLASATYDQPSSNNFQAYYIDVWGNKELLHRDKIFETVCVTPIRPRKRPPMLADKTNDELTHATLYMDDVYADLPGVERGTVKYVRICQMMHWIQEPGQEGIQWHPSANAREHFAFGGTGGAVRTVGIVPVNEDGSALFEVPADVDLYFQALDENFMAVRRMRTHVEFQPGEIRGCIGCHETKTDAVQTYRMGDALAKMTPVRPSPPPHGDMAFLDYEQHIQPIFNAKCVECHAGKEDQGWLDLTAKRDEHGFMQGYRALYGLKAGEKAPNVVWTVTGENTSKERVKAPDHEWWKIMFDDVFVRMSNRPETITAPYEYGAVKHPFAQKLVQDPEHRKLLTQQELQLIMNFFDVQAPYFSTFRQKNGKGLIQVKVEPFPVFSKDRAHKIQHGVDVTPEI